MYPPPIGSWLHIPTNRERRRKRWPWILAAVYVLCCWIAPAWTDNYRQGVVVCNLIFTGCGAVAVCWWRAMG